VKQARCRKINAIGFYSYEKTEYTEVKSNATQELDSGEIGV
jgi:hypothetical protein